MSSASQIEADDFYCLVAESSSVEGRFGLRDCRPRGAESHCLLDLGDWALSPDGRVQLGALAIAADHITGEVPFIRRPPGQWSLTTELTIEFAAGIDVGAVLDLRASPIRIERTGGFALGSMRDETGRDAVTCSTRTLLVPASPVAPADADLAESWGRSPAGARSLDEHLGLRGEELVGAFSVHLDDPSPWQNQFGILHGGVWACLAEVAAARAVERIRPHLVTATVHTVYLRTGPSGAPLTVTATVRHAGSRLALTECVGRTADGTECIITTVTSRSVTERVE